MAALQYVAAFTIIVLSCCCANAQEVLTKWNKYDAIQCDVNGKIWEVANSPVSSNLAKSDCINENHFFVECGIDQQLSDNKISVIFTVQKCKVHNRRKDMILSDYDSEKMSFDELPAFQQKWTAHHEIGSQFDFFLDNTLKLRQCPRDDDRFEAGDLFDSYNEFTDLIPEEAITDGKKWESDEIILFCGLGKIPLKYKCEFAGYTVESAVNCVMFTIKANVTRDDTTVEIMKDMAIPYDYCHIKSEGKITYNPADHILSSVSVKNNIETKMSEDSPLNYREENISIKVIK